MRGRLAAVMVVCGLGAALPAVAEAGLTATSCKVGLGGSTCTVGEAVTPSATTVWCGQEDVYYPEYMTIRSRQGCDLLRSTGDRAFCGIDETSWWGGGQDFQGCMIRVQDGAALVACESYRAGRTDDGACVIAAQQGGDEVAQCRADGLKPRAVQPPYRVVCGPVDQPL